MDSAFTVTPFWNRIPKFFGYGLRRTPLILAAILMGVSLLIGGFLINALLYIVAIKYGAEALKRSMEGDFTPPRLDSKVIHENYALPFKLLFVLLFYIYVLGGVIGSLPLPLSVPLYIAGVLLIPAVIISLVVSEEIGYSLNPFNWWHIASQIGWPYLFMVAFLFFIDGINSTFAGFIIEAFPDGLIAPLLIAINTYFIAVMFHLLGYVVLQYHQQLGGYTPAALADGVDIKKGDPYTTPLLKQLLHDNNVAGVISELSAMIDNNPQDLEPRRRLYVYLKLNGRNDALRDYAPRYFNRLAEQNRFSDAATVYLESTQRGYPFLPDDPADYRPVMQELKRRRATRQAVAMAQGFHQRYPADSHIPEVYLALAQLLSEEMQRDDLAQQALNYVMKGFPHHELIPQVRHQLNVLTTLHGATG
ncbi:MAG TPA: hypothetical protein VGE00_09595 [Gammaproteobacteria bacterium]